MSNKSGKVSKTSNGIHSTVSRKTKNAVRRERTAIEKYENIIRAYEKGQNPWITMENPNKQDRKRRMIKVRANDQWGVPKERKAYSIYGSENEGKKKKANG
jgi:low affinity Fe/Cu permease